MRANSRPKLSAGLLMYRTTERGPEVFLAHPGGPLYVHKDLGVWTIPKGEPGLHEDLLAAAIREFTEEIGTAPDAKTYVGLGSVRQKGGKIVHCWAFESASQQWVVHSNTFEMEWPPRSGRRQAFQEIDCAEFFCVSEARHKLLPAQCEFLDRLVDALKRDPPAA